jgi:hypothetical protein
MLWPLTSASANSGVVAKPNWTCPLWMSASVTLMLAAVVRFAFSP